MSKQSLLQILFISFFGIMCYVVYFAIVAPVPLIQEVEDLFSTGPLQGPAPDLGKFDIKSASFVKSDINLRMTDRNNKGLDHDYSGNIMADVSVEHIPLSEFDFEKNYPIYTSLLDVIEGWNPDNPDPPKHFHEKLAHFDYQNPKEMELALLLRQAEVPFKVYNVPEFDQVSDKWTTSYISEKFDSNRMQSTVEMSNDNHFMFWSHRSRNSVRDWKPPTQLVNMKYRDWLKRAIKADQTKLAANEPHYYYTYGTSKYTRGKTFISQDLDHFKPGENNFFVFRQDMNKGIQCRFGMRGVVAASHYDGGRNMVAMIRGTKRYVLSPPEACKHLGIISDKKHPSFRHSVIDWSDVHQARAHNFDQVNAIDTILREGEVLYIPSYWFHYIVSMEYSIQCNSRSGGPENNIGGPTIDKCMGTKDYSGRGTQSKKKRRSTKSNA